MTKEEVKFFDDMAPKWDSMERRSTPEKVNAILDLVDVRPGMRVLDLGTGTGVLVPYLAERTGATGSVTGVDLSDGMLKEALRKYGSLGNVRFVRKDFELEGIRGKYDLVMLYCVYPHLHRPVEVLKKIIRENLRADGRIEIGFPSDEHFINNIHAEKKAASSLLPDAGRLAAMFNEAGMNARVLAADKERYLVEVRG